MKNKLTNLNDHLFAQLERLSDEDIKGDEPKEELSRAKAVANVSREIISNANLVFKVQVASSSGDLYGKEDVPKMLGADQPK